MRTFKYFLAYAAKNKSRLHQLYFIGVFLQAKVKNKVFVNLDSRYVDYFPEYSNNFGRDLILLKSMYVITNYGKLFSDDLIEWLLEAGFVQYQCQMSIYYKYVPYVTNVFDLSCVDDCIYWYTYEALGKWFVDTLGKKFHVKLLGYAHWFTSIIISRLKDHSISLDQAIYATSIVAKYLYIDIVKSSTKFYNTTLPSDMIFTKADAYTSDEQVDKFTRGFNLHYRVCIG